VSTETRAKVERARDLMKHRESERRPRVLFDRAMDALLEKLEKDDSQDMRVRTRPCGPRRMRPSKARTHPGGGASASLRCGTAEQCFHVDAQGDHCGSRAFLESIMVRTRCLAESLLLSFSKQRVHRTVRREPRGRRSDCGASSDSRARSTFARVSVLTVSCTL